MAGRNHIPAHALNHLREPPPLALARAPHPTALIEDPRLLLHHRPPPPSAVPHPHHHSALVEERLAAQHRDIQSLLLDNQRLAATHVALKQELSAAQQEIRHLSATAGTVKAERDAQVREVYDRSLKMEAEARLIDGLGSELAQVRADVQKLIADRKELTVKLKDVEEDLVRAQSEAQQVPVIKSEIETMHKEIQRGSDDADMLHYKKGFAPGACKEVLTKRNLCYYAVLGFSFPRLLGMFGKMPSSTTSLLGAIWMKLIDEVKQFKKHVWELPPLSKVVHINLEICLLCKLQCPPILNCCGIQKVFVYSYQDFEMFPNSAMNRAAIEFEKKTHASNLEQGQAMERNLISMAREIEKLRAELANAEKRARASAAAAVVATPGPGYAAGYGNPEAGYGGNLYSDPYAVFQPQNSANQNEFSQAVFVMLDKEAHGGADVGPQYGHGAVPHSSYDVQQPHIHG
ncbi:hypothetical protein LguiA_020822 [Lonicera macranthoides]